MSTDTILVANQDPISISRLEQSFTSQQFCILSAESTRTVWDQVENIKIDLIILEETLPSLGGLKLLRLLKIAYPQVPVIITSENPSYKKCLKAFRYGARDCFSKPYDFELLSKKVEIIINNLSENNHLGKNYYLADKKRDLSSKERKILEGISSRNGGICRAVKYLNNNFQKNVSRDELSQMACLSPSHFSRVFKKTYRQLLYRISEDAQN